MHSVNKKTHLIAILKVLLEIDDIQVMKYTIESLIEELEDSNVLSARDLSDFKGDLWEDFLMKK